MYKNQQKLIIDGELLDLNQYINACRAHWTKASIMKQNAEDLIFVLCKKQKLQQITTICFIEYHWFCKNKRKDKSNVSAMGRKVIEDGLQKAGILLQDNWNAVEGFADYFYISKEKPRIEIIIKY